MCDSHKKLGVALELSADLPSPEVLDGWCGEPVKALVVPTSIFLTNKKGFPVLSRAHQAFVKRCFKVMFHTLHMFSDLLSVMTSSVPFYKRNQRNIDFELSVEWDCMRLDGTGHGKVAINFIQNSAIVCLSMRGLPPLFSHIDTTIVCKNMMLAVSFTLLSWRRRS